MGDGSVSDMMWARPALTILGIDCSPVVGSAAGDLPERGSSAEPQDPPGTESKSATAALIVHLRAADRWSVRVTVKTEATGEPFDAAVDGPAYVAIREAMQVHPDEIRNMALAEALFLQRFATAHA